jgi:hemolysin activation/secretion protein
MTLPRTTVAPHLSALAAVLTLAMPAFAQPVTPPDAGQVLRELERTVAPPPRATTTLTLPADADASADTGQRFPVATIRIEGAQGIATAELQALVADLAGRQTSLGELRQGAQRITRLYRERGYVVARAYLPAQDVKDGVVVIAVLEGALNSSAIDNRSVIRQQVLEDIVRAQGLNGRPIEAAGTDRTLLLLADLPAMGNVSGNLKPGERVGTSDLIIDAEAGKTIEGALSLDNHGNRYTGQNRLSGSVNFNSPSGTGDRLALRATTTDQKLWFGRAAYDVPVASDGLRAGLALSSSRYDLGREFAKLDASGTAHTAGLHTSWPMVRGLNRNVWLAGSLEYRKLHDDVASTQSDTDKNARAATFDAYGDLADPLLGGGYNTWRVSGSVGHLKIRTPVAAQADAAGPRAAGGYQKLQASAQRLQSITTQTVLSIAMSGQLASKNLDSSEKFVLGGPDGVRAYPQGEGAGDEGWLANVELRQSLATGLRATAFYDVGQVKFSDRPYLEGRNKLVLRGYGVGLLADWNAFSVQLNVAWRGGTASATAPDKKARAWLVGLWRF